MSLYISGCMSLYMSPWMQTLAAMRNLLHPFGSLDARSEKECVSYIVCRVRQHKTQQPKLSGWQKEEGGVSQCEPGMPAWRCVQPLSCGWPTERSGDPFGLNRSRKQTSWGVRRIGELESWRWRAEGFFRMMQLWKIKVGSKQVEEIHQQSLYIRMCLWNHL